MDLEALWRRIGTGEPPGQLGACRGALLVIGCGRTVFEDLAAVDHDWPGARLVVNDIGIFYPREVQHWASLHRNHFPSWLRLRLLRGADSGRVPLTHANRAFDRVAQVWPIECSGTSGLFGAVVGVLMGYDPVVLAGIPLDAGGRFYDAPGTGQDDYVARHVTIAWEAAAAEIFAGRVTSLSGRTRAMLGAPSL